jgi:hypothetical protein
MKLRTLLTTKLCFFIVCFVQGQTSSIELTPSISLTATMIDFEPSAHHYDTCDTRLGWTTICLIDGEPWFGCNKGMDLPQKQLTQLALTIRGQKTELDVSGMYNPTFDTHISPNQFKIKQTSNEYTLYGFFSDGAGSYTCKWLIINGASVRCLISANERDFIWQLEE